MDDEAIAVGHVVITCYIEPGGESTITVALDPADMPVIELLGLLELAKGYPIHRAGSHDGD